MILTGKAEEEFFNWLDNQGVNGIDISNWEFEKFQLLSNVSQNALIIEWFDSVGIYINIENLYYQSWWSYKVKIIPNIFEEKVMVKTRQEATEKAIKKANEIYNSN